MPDKQLQRFLRENLLLIILLFLAIYRIATFEFPYKDGDVVKISARVSSEPSVYDTSTIFEVANLSVKNPTAEKIEYGDHVVVTGKVQDGKLEDAHILEVTPAKGIIYKLRKRILNFYRTSLPSPNDGLVAGFVIGSKSGIPSTLWESLKKTGTAHVVVASGMNVTLVAGFLISFFVTIFNRRKALILGIAGVWFYAVMAGFDAPIVRAAIMASIAFGSQEAGRINYAWRGLVFSALVMVIVRPFWISDLGFILSFAATASLMIFEKPIERKLRRVPGLIREDLSTSLAAQIGVAPILFFTFGYVNVLSPLINALVLWTIVPVTIIGSAAGILSLIFEPLARMLVLLAYPLTSWFLWVVTLFGK